MGAYLYEQRRPMTHPICSSMFLAKEVYKHDASLNRYPRLFSHGDSMRRSGNADGFPKYFTRFRGNLVTIRW